MGVPFEKASDAAKIIEGEIDYLLQIDPRDIFDDTRARLEDCEAKLERLLWVKKRERSND